MGAKPMTEIYPNLVYSDLGGDFNLDGITVKVLIVQLEGSSEWTLEVRNSKGKSIVWDEASADDRDAYDEFKRQVADEGMKSFFEESNVIPFSRPRP